MDNILEMRRKENSGEEILAGYTPEFPYVSSRTFVSRYDVLWHWHKSVELFYIEEGTLEYETPQGRVICPAGTGGLVNAGVLHTTRSQESHTVQLLHIFNPVLLSGQREGLIYQKYFSPILSAPQIELLPITRDHVDTLEKLRASFRIPPCAPAYELQLRESLTSIWLDLLPLLPTGLEPGEELSSERIKEMMLYVWEHYQEDIRTADVAAAGYVCQRECYRLFHQFLHTTPAEYIRSCRLHAACRMLAEGSETITEISRACGFGTSSFLGKVFRANLDTTPIAYRRIWQNHTN